MQASTIAGVLPVCGAASASVQVIVSRPIQVLISPKARVMLPPFEQVIRFAQVVWARAAQASLAVGPPSTPTELDTFPQPVTPAPIAASVAIAASAPHDAAVEIRVSRR